jgi:LysM domain
VAQPSRRRTSMAVRRRRTLLAATALLLVGLALPLSGTGGHSHPTGSAPAETVGAVSYTVQPGDSLWTIAERVSPTSDPRPLVAQMASELGSATVVPGERITVP